MKNERIPLADILKGIAVVRMILVHLMDVFAAETLSSSSAGKLLLFLAGPPGAALFMIIMGYFVAKSEKRLSVSIFRGLKLIFWGLLLNIGMNLHLLFLIISGQSSVNPWPFVFGVDILFLAGFSLILLNFSRKLLKDRLSGWLILFVGLTTASGILPALRFNSPPMVYLLSFFWGGQSWSYFPVFPWAAYPVAGYIFYHLNQKYDLSLFSSKGLAYLAVMMVAMVAAGFPYALKVISSYEKYYNHNLLFSLWLIAITLLWIAAIYLIAGKRENILVFRWFRWVGKNVTSFYVVQWLLIGNIGTALYKSQQWWQVLVWFVAVAAASTLIVRGWKWVKTRTAY